MEPMYMIIGDFLYLGFWDKSWNCIMLGYEIHMCERKRKIESNNDIGVFIRSS